MNQLIVEKPKAEKLLRSTTLTKNIYDPKTYEFDDRFKPWDGNDPMTVHTTGEMLECLGKNQNIELDAKVIGFQDGRWKTKKIDKTK